MTPGTAGWLIAQLGKVPEDTPIMVYVSNTYFRLSGKIDKVIREYAKTDRPELSFFEDFLCLFLEDDKPPTPKLTENLPQN